MPPTGQPDGRGPVRRGALARARRQRALARATPPPRGPRGYVRLVAWGAAWLALPMVACAGLTALLGEDSVIAFITFLVLLTPGALFAWIAPSSGSTLLPLTAMMVMILTPWSVVFLPEVSPFGHVPVREAGSPRTAPYVPRGAEPRPEFQRDVDIAYESMHRPMRGGSGYPVMMRGNYTVVPLLPPGWNPSQPVHAVAMLDRPGRGAGAEHTWPAQGGLVPLRDSRLRQEAAREALAMAGLQPAHAIAIGRWSDNPWRTRIDELAPTLLTYAGAVAALALLLLLDRLRRS